MKMSNVLPATGEDPAHRAAQAEADREAGMRPVEIDGLAPSDANDVRLGGCPIDARCNDVDVMPELSRLARKEVHVLADAAQVWIVELSDYRYAHRQDVARAA